MNNKESLYRKIWVVALPIIFQNIIDASVNSADVLMLNYVGQDAISAVSFLLCTDEFVKWPWVLKHFYSHKWARNITREEMD